MPNLDGLDYYSQGSGPDPAVTASAGLEYVGRYLFAGDKGITNPERAGLHTAGLGVFAYVEYHAGYLLDTNMATIRDYGKRAVDQALALTWPAGLPHVHSIDTNVTPDQYPALGRSFEQLRATESIYTIGGYGEAGALDWLHARDLISFAVQTAAIGWDGNRVAQCAAVWQYAADVTWRGHNVDFLTTLNRPLLEHAVWWAPGHTQPDVPRPPSEEDTDMFMIYPADNPKVRVLVDAGAATTLQDGASVQALTAAGVKTVKVSRRDFDNLRGAK